MGLIQTLIESSTHAVVLGDRVTYYPQRVTVDCNLATEIAIYNSVLLRLSGKVCPNLEEVETERAIYQVSSGVLYSLCADFDR